MQFAQTLDGSTGTAQIGPGRAAFEQWLRTVGVSGDTAAELAIVFSELAANAVTASPGGSVVHIRAVCNNGEIVLEAENGSPHSTPRSSHAWDLADPLRPGGRGLLIVTAYMDNVEVAPADEADGILVRCRRNISF